MAEQGIPHPLGNVVVLKRIACPIAEHKSVVASGLALVLQGVVDQLWHFNVPVAAVGFGLLDLPIHQCLANQNLPALKVDAIPLQPVDLTGPKTGKEANGVVVPEICPNSGENQPNLLQ